MNLVKSPMHLIDLWSLKSFLKLLKSLKIILISMKSNDLKISYAIYVSVGPLEHKNELLTIYATCIKFHIQPQNFKD